MTEPAGLQALRLLKAFGKIDDQRVREIVLQVAEAAAAGAEVKAKLLPGLPRDEPVEKKPN